MSWSVGCPGLVGYPAIFVGAQTVVTAALVVHPGSVGGDPLVVRSGLVVGVALIVGVALVLCAALVGVTLVLGAALVCTAVVDSAQTGVGVAAPALTVSVHIVSFFNQE